MKIAMKIGRALGGGAPFATVVCLVMYAVYAARTPSALSIFGITNVLNDAVVLAIGSAGLTLVILAGEFDLSGVGVIAIANVLVATTSGASGFGALGSLALVLAIGLLVGTVNGVLVAFFQLQSLAATIGTMIACEGVALLILPAPGGEVSDKIATGLTGDLAGVIPVALLILGGFAAAWFVFKRTSLGVAIYATGADAQAARLSGIDLRRTRLVAFMLAGLCYAFAGYMLSAETGTGDPRVSSALLLFMYAAVAIGGTSLSGGKGGVFGSLVGAGILMVLQKMLFALGVAEFYTNIFNGIVMIFALLFGNIVSSLAGSLRRQVAK